MASSLSVSGLGSGLDVTGIVNQLMELEKRPLTALAKKEAGVQAQISAFGAIKGSLSTLQNAIAGLKMPSGGNALDFYSTYKGSVSEEGIASVTAGEGTVPGRYSLEVSQLAKEHRIVSNAETAIGTGMLTIQLGSADGATVSKTTTVEITNASLTSVRDAINRANAGVTAAVINGDNGPQLVISGEQGGSKQFISLSGVSGLEYAPAGGPTNFTEQQAAQSALIKLNGVSIESQGNKVADALQGVTLDLRKATEDGQSVTLDLTRDTSSINRALERMVTAFNDYHKLSRDVGGYDSAAKKGGALLGDSALRSVDAKMRSMLSNVPPELAGNGLRTLSDIGISLQKDGTLKLDTDKLDKALSDNFAGVANVAAAYGRAMDEVITGMIGSNGMITGKTEGLNRSITSMAQQRTVIERRLEGIEARYKAQFVALDSLVSGMMQTSNYLETQLKSLSKISSS